MDKKTIIKLYDLGILDIDGEVNEPVIEEMGYEDGEAFVSSFWILFNAVLPFFFTKGLGYPSSFSNSYGRKDWKTEVVVITQPVLALTKRW